MSSSILFTDEGGGVLSMLPCRSDDSAHGELITLAAQFLRAGWLLNADLKGGYAATPPSEMDGLLSAVRQIALRRGI